MRSTLTEHVYSALDGCKVAVLLASRTYGRSTTSFSTYHELNFVMDEKKPFYLVKMCESWEEAHVRGKFGTRTSWRWWAPGQPMPNGIVSEIRDKVTASQEAEQSRVSWATTTLKMVWDTEELGDESEDSGTEGEVFSSCRMEEEGAAEGKGD